MKNIKEIFEMNFSIIDDTRCQCDVKYPLVDVLIIIMCGILCNQTEIDEIIDYSEAKIDMLSKYFGIKKIPSESTIKRILNMVNAETMSLCIVNIMREMFGLTGDVVAIDGKTICSTTKMKAYKEKLHIMSAYLTESGVSLGQLSISEKTNEIPCMLDLLDLINVKNKTITADAMHCQKKTAEKIIESKCNYVLQVKRNQENLYNDIELMFKDFLNGKNDESKLDIYETLEKGHGRIEKRICYVLSNIDWLYSKEEWAGLKKIFAIKRITTTGKKSTTEISYYITSLNSNSSELLQIAREHWKIESMHWFLDVVMSEDECRIVSKNGQRNMNTFKKLALAMHKNYTAKLPKKISMKRNMHKCLLDDKRLFDVIKSFV